MASGQVWRCSTEEKCHVDVRPGMSQHPRPHQTTPSTSYSWTSGLSREDTTTIYDHSVNWHTAEPATRAKSAVASGHCSGLSVTDVCAPADCDNQVRASRVHGDDCCCRSSDISSIEQIQQNQTGASKTNHCQEGPRRMHPPKSSSLIKGAASKLGKYYQKPTH